MLLSRMCSFERKSKERERKVGGGVRLGIDIILKSVIFGIHIEIFLNTLIF